MKKNIILVSVLIIIIATSAFLWNLHRNRTQEENDFTSIEISSLDVGKADCNIITLGNKVIVIDTGYSSTTETVMQELDGKNIKTIDYLIISHFDKDHVGGAADILNNYQVKNVIEPDYKETSEEMTAYRNALTSAGITPNVLHSDLKLSIGAAEITVMPPKESEYNKDNNYSIIVSLKYLERSFLFMGDAEKLRLQEFTAENSQTYDFVKMPHHGRYNKASESFVKSISPDYAVITCSSDEMPEEDLLNILDTNNVSTYLTVNGKITITSDGHNLDIQQ